MAAVAAGGAKIQETNTPQAIRPNLWSSEDRRNVLTRIPFGSLDSYPMAERREFWQSFSSELPTNAILKVLKHFPHGEKRAELAACFTQSRLFKGKRSFLGGDAARHYDEIVHQVQEALPSSGDEERGFSAEEMVEDLLGPKPKTEAEGRFFEETLLELDGMEVEGVHGIVSKLKFYHEDMYVSFYAAFENSDLGPILREKMDDPGEDVEVTPKMVKEAFKLAHDTGALDGVTALNNHDAELWFLPPEIKYLKNLQGISLTMGHRIMTLPPLDTLTKLTYLAIINNSDSPSLSVFPPSICKLSQLKELDLRFCAFKMIPKEISNLQGLKDLKISYSGIEFFPKALTELENLTTLNLQGCKGIKAIPVEIHKLQKLEKLLASETGLISLPLEAFLKMPKLNLVDVTSLDGYPRPQGFYPKELGNGLKMNPLDYPGYYIPLRES